MEIKKNQSALSIIIFCFLIILALLDMYISSSSIGVEIFKNIQILLKAVLLPPCLFYIIIPMIKYLKITDFLCLLISESLLFYCALSTGTHLNFEYFWIFIFLLAIVTTISHINSINYNHEYLKTGKFKNLIYATTILISTFSLAANANFWLLEKNDFINPNAACAISGITLVFLTTFIVNQGLDNSAKSDNLSNICLFFIFLSTITSFSRVSIIWISITVIIASNKWKNLLSIKKICNFILIFFCCLTLLINISTFTGNSVNLIEFIEEQSIDWRIKGDTSSDIQRLKYYDVVMNYLKDEELLTGAGFGNRGYRMFLAEGEDVHNAFLTTLSDSGYIGTYTVIFICCLWPWVKLLLIKRRNYWQYSIFLTSLFSSATFFPTPLYGSQYFSVALLYLLLLLKLGDPYKIKK